MAGTPQNTTTLQSYFETGDIPTEEQFANLMQSFQNIVDGNQLKDFNTNITAVTPPDQNTAPILSNLVNAVSSFAGFSGGVRMPSAVAGRILYLSSKQAGFLTVFPADGENFINMDANEPLTMLVNEMAMFICFNDGIWTYQVTKAVDTTLKQILLNLTQFGEDAPTGSYINNSSNKSVSFSRIDFGIYNLFIPQGFVFDKTFISNQSGRTSTGWFLCSIIDEFNIQIFSFNDSTNDPSDNVLNNSQIGIQFYE